MKNILFKGKQIDNGGKTGIELIAEERKRQIEIEGLTPEHDKEHIHCELVLAACAYALPTEVRNTYGRYHTPTFWPFGVQWWKPTPDDRIRELVKAGALIAAEIDRLQSIPE